MPSALFALVIFEMGAVSLYACLAWTMILLFMLPCVAGMTSSCHWAQPLVEMGSHKLFVSAGVKPRSSQSPPPKEARLQVWATVPDPIMFVEQRKPLILYRENMELIGIQIPARNHIMH
jgi:hypothetical protein